MRREVDIKPNQEHLVFFHQVLQMERPRPLNAVLFMCFRLNLKREPHPHTTKPCSFKHPSIASSSVHAWRRCLKVNTFNLDTLAITLADKVAEETESALALALDLDSLFTLSTQILETLVETNSKVISRNAENLANR
jgi:hypothetical protein